MTYDPVPDLGELIDALHAYARIAAVPGSEIPLAAILAGPYARLRGGLLLDEPGREHLSTEQALREALAGARSADDLLLRTFQAFIDARVPRSDRTAEFTIDGAAFYRVTPGQRTVLMSVAPARIRELNDVPASSKEESTSRTGDST